MHHRSHLGAQRIVVAEAQLIDGYGVVFVDDGHRVPLQNDLKRVEGVLIAPAVPKIVPRQKDLRAHDAACREKAGIFFQQQALAHCSGRLLCRDARGPLRITNAAEACRHRAGGHQNDRVPGRPQRRGLRHNGFNFSRADTPIRVGQGAGANLDRNELSFHRTLTLVCVA